MTRESGSPVKRRFENTWLRNSLTCLPRNLCCSLLICIPTGQEIKAMIFYMHSQKAPGPDGLPALFYQRYWNIVGSTVIEAIQSFFRSDRILKEVNNSLLVLIPKINSPSSVNHFRPISLCNTVYKTISKLLVSRLRPLLEKLISPCQSASSV